MRGADKGAFRFTWCKFTLKDAKGATGYFLIFFPPPTSQVSVALLEIMFPGIFIYRDLNIYNMDIHLRNQRQYSCQDLKK